MRLEQKLLNADIELLQPDNPEFYLFMQDYAEHLSATGITE